MNEARCGSSGVSIVTPQYGGKLGMTGARRTRMAVATKQGCVTCSAETGRSNGLAESPRITREQTSSPSTILPKWKDPKRWNGTGERDGVRWR
jgi:hypothetical protein